MIIIAFPLNERKSMFSLQRIFKEKRAQKVEVSRHKALARSHHDRLVVRTLEMTGAEKLGIKDMFDHRFEVLVLLISCTLFKLIHTDRRREAEALWELMFEAFDHSLRQQGVTDVRMGSRMRKLLLHATGRRQAYVNALEAGDEETLREAIRRNVLSGAEETGEDPMIPLMEAVEAVQKEIDL